MKSFRFRNIRLLSQKEQRGRLATFHPGKNLILGLNHTGKSTLIKSLFEALGAKPKGQLDRWDDKAISLVEFSVDDSIYRVLHCVNNRALFTSDSELITSTSNLSEWHAAFSDVTGFNLVLSDDGHGGPLAGPACFFLPFYVNQDGSWQGGWHTFQGMPSGRAPIRLILDYFCGICPPEYYQLKADLSEVKKRLRELSSDRASLDRARARLDQAMPLTGPKADPLIFEKEIEQLTSEMTQLNRRQEELRARSVREQELLESLRLQIALAHRELATYDSSMGFLCDHADDTLVCPTCGAEHENSFLHVLGYAEDARVLRELVVQLHKDEAEIKERCKTTQLKHRQLDIHYRRLAEILDTKRGELHFGEVIHSMGTESAFGAFDAEGRAIGADIASVLERQSRMDMEISRLSNPKVRRDITEHFRKCYEMARFDMSLPQADLSNVALSSRPSISGSSGPRAILAYYGALWQTCHHADRSFLVPAVIDCPNQQAQDRVHLPQMLKFIATGLPEGMQIIVTLEQETDAPFDHILELDQPYELLKESEYDAVSQLVYPMYQAMLTALLEEGFSSRRQD